MPELQRLRADHAPAVLAFELANRDYFTTFISDRGNDFYEHFTERFDELLAEQDAGTGTSKFTWQAVLGIGYSFHWGDLLLDYRYLSFEQGHDQPLQRLSFAGPALGATWHF